MTTKHQQPDVDDTADLSSACPTADSPHWWTAAKAEHAALKQWKLDGENGDRPATPTLDEMNDRYVAAGCAPGSSSPKRTRSTSSTPRAPKMSDVDITRRLRELLDETPTLSQTGAVDALTAEGATIRQVRAAYKVETSNRPKPAKPAKRTTSTKKKPAAKKPATSSVLDEIRQPHTAAELVAIAERENIGGVRVKMGKAAIVARMTEVVTARQRKTA